MICECMLLGKFDDPQYHRREQGKLRVPELLPADYVGSTQDTGGYVPSG